MKNIFKTFFRINRIIYLIRAKRRWKLYKKMGMKIGRNVNLPPSTWIDTSHCFLISIGDNTGFGAGCAILAHDAMSNEFLDATKIGRVKIRDSCHFGMRTIILPGVEIGPRSIIGANSVVTKDIPPDSVATGNPAKVICSLESYLEKQRKKMNQSPLFEYEKYSYQYINDDLKKQIIKDIEGTEGYIIGGYTAMRKNIKVNFRTN